MTIMALVASALAWLRMRRGARSPGLRRAQFSLTGLCIVSAALLLAYRAVYVTKGWHPLGAHVDGLLLIGVLFAASMVFVQRTRIRGLAAFALPLFTLILAWGICASAWTYEPFSTPSMWNAAHMFGVYVGSLFCFLAAASGGMYLYVERRLRRHRRLAPMASLEAIESLNIRTAAVAFSMISIGLVTGLIIVSGKETLVAGWWYSPKIVLAAAAWLAYAVVMNVRFATAFRGTRAAWLSIAGLLLLVATFGVVKSLEPVGAAQAPESAGVETVLVLSGAGTGAGVGVGSMERRRT